MPNPGRAPRRPQYATHEFRLLGFVEGAEGGGTHGAVTPPLLTDMVAARLLLAAPALAVSPDAPASLVNPADRNLRVRLHGELGAVLPVSHTLQFDKDGTDFDLVKDGGQDNIFFF